MGTYVELAVFASFILLHMTQTSYADYCSGTYCDSCCGSSCCNDPYYYSSFSFWNLWYFWFVMFIIIMTCCGMCSYAKRRQYYTQQQSRVIIHSGNGTGAVNTQQFPVGVVAPPVHMPPQPMPQQMPPAYNEVTSKPELYPSYQGSTPYPQQQPYPPQTYYHPSQQQQVAYPPGPPVEASAPPPAYTPTPNPY